LWPIKKRRRREARKKSKCLPVRSGASKGTAFFLAKIKDIFKATSPNFAPGKVFGYVKITLRS